MQNSETIKIIILTNCQQHLGSLFNILSKYETGWLLTYAFDPARNIDTEFLRKALETIVDAMDGDEVKLLDLFCGSIISFGSVTHTYRAKFYRDDFARLAAITDERLYINLRKKYSDLTGLLTERDKLEDKDGRDAELTNEKMIAFYQWYYESNSVDTNHISAL